MDKELRITQAGRRGHLCCAPDCGRRIQGRMPAIVLTIKEASDGEVDKHIFYFCSVDCYNEYEARLVYSAGAAADPG